MTASLPTKSQTGQGLIEGLLAFAILIILFHAFGSLVITAYDLLGNSRTRTTARHLANERLEEIRNLPYDSIGVIGGIPPGVLDQLETVDRNGLEYSIRTSVIYIDDPFDFLAPSDPYPTDYKRTRVDVSWTGRFTAGESITLISDVASQEVTGGGTLSILVFDANALPVPQTDVHIINTAVDPNIDLEVKTDDNGRLVLPGAPPCDTCYQITVSKENYSTDRTYDTSEVANPEKPHSTVLEGELTEISFAIDLFSVLTVHSTMDRNNLFAPLGNKAFTLTGGKTIGLDTLGDPVYKYSAQLQTNDAGELRLENMEWDNYSLSFEEPSSWDFAGFNPLQPMSLPPDSDFNSYFASSLHQNNNLLLAVSNASGSAIASASAQLDGPGGFNKTLFTGQSEDPDFAQAFFSPLQPASYNLTVTKTGYIPFTDTITVNEQTFYTAQLDAIE